MGKYLVFLLTIFLLMFTFSASAQNNCVTVRGIAQVHLLDFTNPDWQGGRPGDAWVGPVQLAAGNETFIGKLSEFDGEPGPSNHTGQGRNTGSLYIDLGTDGSFIVRYPHAVWPTLPKVGAFMGTFHGQGSLDPTNGTGRFVHATGNLTIDGPFLAWNLDQPPPSGRFNATISGTVCNLLP
jgi:hypothetical protein